MKKVDLLSNYIKIADIHARRISMSLKHFANILPFDENKINNLSDDDLGYLELLVNRFAKLQDLLGSKIFPLLLQKLQEDSENFSLLDRLNKLEKLQLLPSAHDWVKMRELRNHVTHEYPDSPNIMVKNLNYAVKYAKQLLSYWDFLKDKL